MSSASGFPEQTQPEGNVSTHFQDSTESTETATHRLVFGNLLENDIFSSHVGLNGQRKRPLPEAKGRYKHVISHFTLSFFFLCLKIHCRKVKGI